MPLFETVCLEDGCSEYRRVHENYLPRWDSPDPDCEACGARRKRLISAANPVFVKPLGHYADPSKEGYREAVQAEGHWVWRKNSTRRPDGKPEREFITTRAQQHRYCREEGLIPPDDCPNHLQIDKTGTKLSSAGMPGCWT